MTAAANHPSGNSPRVTQLFRRLIDQHDRAARDELVQLHLGLANSLAGRYAGGSEPIEDIRQVAGIALVKAVDRYDPTREIPFSAYAVPCVLGEIKRYFRDFGWSVHIGRQTQELVLALRNARTHLEQDGHSATVAELASFLKVSDEQILEALNASASQHAVSYDKPANDEDDNTVSILDRLAETDSGFEQIERRELLDRASDGLDSRQQQVLELYYHDERTQIEIAHQLGISQMQVSRILKSALASMRAAIHSDETATSRSDAADER